MDDAPSSLLTRPLIFIPLGEPLFLCLVAESPRSPRSRNHLFSGGISSTERKSRAAAAASRGPKQISNSRKPRDDRKKKKKNVPRKFFNEPLGICIYFMEEKFSLAESLLVPYIYVCIKMFSSITHRVGTRESPLGEMTQIAMKGKVDKERRIIR